MLPKTRARAGPNNRLKIAFGINNAFTTDDDMFRKKFRGIASRHLRNFDGKWSSTGNSARSLVREALDGARKGVRIVSLIQILAMRLSLQAVHGVDIDLIDNSKLIFIAGEINRLWVASKNESTLQSWSKQVKLHRALHAVCPNSNCYDPERNPLNLILPSYETLWRVVLRCFVEVVFHRQPDLSLPCGSMESLNEHWRKRLHEFLISPSTETLEDGGEHGVSVLDIAKETLRLYPPTRRVYREFQYDDDSKSELVAADIEALQRNSVRHLAMNEFQYRSFVPEVWAEHEGDLNEVFMPFGREPFLCPAQTKFAYWAIAILVAALSIEVKDEWMLDPDPLAGEAWNKPMETDREAYRDIILKTM